MFELNNIVDSNITVKKKDLQSSKKCAKYEKICRIADIDIDDG